jgi:hypothetical protein
LNCEVSLCADDTILYKAINDSSDEGQFQRDIDAVFNWSCEWMLEFNTEKCKIINFNLSSSAASPSYTLGTENLQVANSALYLGVWLTSNLSWTLHINNKVKKAYQILGFLKRTLFQAPKKVKLLAYKTLVRPILEYGCQVWDPVKKCDINLLEAVQKKAVRFICNIKGRQQESITSLTLELGLDPLEWRRYQSRMTLFHRVLVDSGSENPGPVSAGFPELAPLDENDGVITRSIFNSQPRTQAVRTGVYHSSFLPRSIRDLKNPKTRIPTSSQENVCV